MKTWAKRAAIGVSAWVVPVVVMSAAGMNPRPLPIAALVAAVVVAVSLVVDANADTATGDWPLSPRSEQRTAEDRRVYQLHRTVESAVARDGDSTALRNVLAQVVATRVRAVHGVERDRDPERFAAIVGGDLATWLDAPADGHRPTSMRQLGVLLTRIEGL